MRREIITTIGDNIMRLIKFCALSAVRRAFIGVTLQSGLSLRNFAAQMAFEDQYRHG